MVESNFSKTGPIHVLIVDDSAFIRQSLRAILEEDPDIKVIGMAHDPYDAREKIKLLNPDVITLDINMPRMNGLEFLEKLMRLRPMPVIMVSTLTEKGAKETIEALSLGAVDYVEKPTDEKKLLSLGKEICQKVKMAARAKIKPLKNISQKNILTTLTKSKPENTFHKIIAIGSSTGGVEALTEIITALRPPTPPILITQHMPEKFTTSFANRLHRISALHVIEAFDGVHVQSNSVYLAPGNYHMVVEKIGLQTSLRTHQEKSVSGHRPSVDVMFKSCSQSIAKQCVAFLLTGMGKDGAEGMKELHDQGGLTFSQNEESCLVYGMPRAAKELNAIEREVHLNEVATIIMQYK